MTQAETVNDAEQTRAGLKKLLDYIEETTGQIPQSEDRRKNWRYSWPAPATVEVIEVPGQEQQEEQEESSNTLYVTVHGISAESMDFYSPRELDVDTRLTVTFDTEDGQLSVPAIVMRSLDSVGKPLVAVDFEID